MVLLKFDQAKVDAQYNWSAISKAAAVIKQGAAERSDINQLFLPEVTRSVINFVDARHDRRRWLCVMRGSLDGAPLPDKVTCHCFYDHHPFDTQPIGTPIAYVPLRVRRKYYSHAEKANLTENREIRPTETEQYIKDGWTLLDGDYYSTDAICCGLSCALSYIIEQEKQGNPLYRHSRSLLYQMARRITGTADIIIHPALDIRLLSAYNGPMAIEGWRKAPGMVQMVPTGNYYRRRPLQFPIGTLFRQIDHL
jgi:hypothetical protein